MIAGRADAEPSDVRIFDRIDAVLLTACAILTAAYALLLLSLWHGWQPINNVYFGGDPRRIWVNLNNLESSFHRTAMHPLFTSLCALTVNLSQWTGWRGETLLAFGCGVYGLLVGGLTYAVARLWGAARGWAVGAVALLWASGSFVSWSSIAESHSYGGLSCLIVLLGAALLAPAGPRRLLGSAVLFVIATSMVITNTMLWPFATCIIAAKDRTNLAGLIQIARRNFFPLLLSLGAGLLLLYGLWLVQKAYLSHNPTLGDFLSFERDSKYFYKFGMRDKFHGLYAFGLVAPSEIKLERIIGMSISVVMLGLTALGLRKASVQLRLMLIFLGVVLVFHSLYARSEAFIPSANYVPVVAILVMIALSNLARSTWSRAMVAAGVVLLGAYNLAAHVRVVQDLPLSSRFAVNDPANIIPEPRDP